MKRILSLLSVLLFWSACAQSEKVALSFNSIYEMRAHTVRGHQTNLIAVVAGNEGAEKTVAGAWWFAPGDTTATNTLTSVASSGVAGRWLRTDVPLGIKYGGTGNTNNLRVLVYDSFQRQDFIPSSLTDYWHLSQQAEIGDRWIVRNADNYNITNAVLQSGNVWYYPDFPTKKAMYMLQETPQRVHRMRTKVHWESGTGLNNDGYIVMGIGNTNVSNWLTTFAHFRVVRNGTGASHWHIDWFTNHFPIVGGTSTLDLAYGTWTPPAMGTASTFDVEVDPYIGGAYLRMDGVEVGGVTNDFFKAVGDCGRYVFWEIVYEDMTDPETTPYIEEVTAYGSQYWSPLPLAFGGTDAITATAARANLDAQQSNAALTALSADPAMYQHTNANLTLWQAIAPVSKQDADTQLAAIAALPDAAGYLKNSGLGVFSYDTPTGTAGSDFYTTNVMGDLVGLTPASYNTNVNVVSAHSTLDRGGGQFYYDGSASSFYVGGVELTAGGSSYTVAPATFTKVAGGSGWVVNDEFTVTVGGSDATFKVATVSGGAVLTATYVSGTVPTTDFSTLTATAVAPATGIDLTGTLTYANSLTLASAGGTAPVVECHLLAGVVTYLGRTPTTPGPSTGIVGTYNYASFPYGKTAVALSGLTGSGATVKAWIAGQGGTYVESSVNTYKVWRRTRADNWNIRFFGADPTAAYDASDEIQAAFNSAQAFNNNSVASTVYAPAGEYIVDSTLRVQYGTGYRMFRLKGDGKNSSTFRATRTTYAPIMLVGGENHYTDFVGVEGIRFQGPTAIPHGTGGDEYYCPMGLVFFSQGNRISVNDCAFRNLSKGLVLHSQNNNYATLRDLYFTYCTLALDGVEAHGTYLQCLAEGNKHGIWMEGRGQDITINIQGTQYGGINVLLNNWSGTLANGYNESASPLIAAGVLRVGVPKTNVVTLVVAGDGTNCVGTVTNFHHFRYGVGIAIDGGAGASANCNGIWTVTSTNALTNWFSFALSPAAPATPGTYTLNASDSPAFIMSGPGDLSVQHAGAAYQAPGGVFLDYCYGIKMDLGGANAASSYYMSTNANACVVTPYPSWSYAIGDLAPTNSSQYPSETKNQYRSSYNLFGDPGLLGYTNAFSFVNSYYYDTTNVLETATTRGDGAALRIQFMTNYSTGANFVTGHFHVLALPDAMSAALAGSTVIASMWVYVPNETPWTGAAFPLVGIYGGTGNTLIGYVSDTTATTPWRKGAWNFIHGRFNIPAGTTSVRFRIIAYDIGTGNPAEYVILDDIYIGLANSTTWEGILFGRSSGNGAQDTHVDRLWATNSIILNSSTGTKISSDNDGAITFKSLSAGAEDITINLDDTANVIDLTSSTGVDTIRWTNTLRTATAAVNDLVVTNTGTIGGNNIMRWRGTVGAGAAAPTSLIGGDMFKSNVTIYIYDGTGPDCIPLN